MDSDPYAERWKAVARELSVVIGHRRAHGQCRPYGVVTLPRIGLQRAEVCHDAVAQEFGDVAAMVMDRITHVLKVTVQHACEYASFQLFTDFSVADQIGKEHRHDFVLWYGKRHEGVAGH